MTTASWDARAADGRPELAGLLADEHRYVAVFRSWDDLLTFALLAVTQLALALSIARANWVDEMPPLPLAAAIGLVTGTLLSRLRLSALWLLPTGILTGFAVVVGMTIRSMELADPAAGDTFAIRWSELWARMADWSDALVSAGVSRDPLPFVLLLVFLLWLLPYIAAWAVFRWRSPWLALVPSGLALLTNISYLPGKPSFEFILFLFAAVLLFAQLQLVRTIDRWRGQRVALPSLLSLEVLHAGAWLGVGLLLAAWVVPAGDNVGPLQSLWNRAIQPVVDRLEPYGQVFIGIDAKQSQVVHQFENALPLQGRVRLEGDTMYRVTAPSTDVPFLRANVYDEYSRSGWTLSGTDDAPLPATTIEAASFGTPETREQFRLPVTVTFQAESPLAADRLLSAGDPIAADVDASYVTGADPLDLIGLRASDDLDHGAVYTTVGSVSVADVNLLVAAGTDYPQWVRDRYLQLPDSLPDRVRDLALEVGIDGGTPYLAALRIEQYLRANYPYDLRVDDPPPRRDPVDFFLFEEQAGYFDHHASAMVVMLRSLGIPARIAVGFALDEADLDDATKTYVISERNSWAWPEVYFPGLGWVEFNPTPSREAVARPGDSSLLLDTDTAAPSGPVNLDPLAFIDDETLFGSSGDDTSTFEFDSADEGSPLDGRLVLWLGALLAAAAALVLVVRLAWEYPFRGLAPAAARWARVQRLAGWAGVPLDPQRTALEEADAIARDLEARDAPVHLLARDFTRERYGGNAAAPPLDEPSHLDRLYRSLRNRLLRAGLRRRLGLRR